MIHPGESWPFMRLAVAQYSVAWTLCVVLFRCNYYGGWIFYTNVLDYCSSVFEVDYPCLWWGNKRDIHDIDDRTRYSFSQLRQWYFGPTGLLTAWVQ